MTQKKLWKTIDYNDNSSKSAVGDIDESVVSEYFRGIFQADRLKNNPTIDDVKASLSEYTTYVPALDDDFTIDELNDAIKYNGNGIGLDSLDKKIASLFTVKLRQSVLHFFNLVYSTVYPDIWRKQLLRPEAKKGHTLKNPKLRGIAISQLMSTLYDIMIYRRFNNWYKPNFEQAGAREKQGCVLQIFSIYVMMEYMESIGKKLFVGFLDYEKAFDFVSRGNLIKHLQEKGAGAKFTRAIASMYEVTSYVPKLGNRAGDEILAKHGVTQGRQTSTSLFSFEVQDMGKSINVPESIINDTNLLQLADDSAILAEEKVFLEKEFKQILEFSTENYMSKNVGKTVFLHLSDANDTDPIYIGNTVLHSAERDEYLYLGMKFVASSNIVVHIQRNLKDRMFHVTKFYEWVHVNKTTPFPVKLNVLYTCMFAAYLYGSEAWWRIDEVSTEILALERKLLKCVLGVKPFGTPDDLIYIELGRHDIISIVKHRQKLFFQRLLELGSDEAVARRIVDLYRELPMFSYYDELNTEILSVSMSERFERSVAATATYSSRYHDLIDTQYNHIIYDSYLPEYCRRTITRWRLSCHGLRIETGRKETPKVPRMLRLCSICPEVEDEKHVIFDCSLYSSIRSRFSEHLEVYPTVQRIFNPVNYNDALVLGNFLNEIENLRKSLQLE